MTFIGDWEVGMQLTWYSSVPALAKYNMLQNEAKKPDPILPPQHWTETYQKNLFQDPHFATVLKYLQEKRGLHPNVLQKYLVGATVEPLPPLLFLDSLPALRPISFVMASHLARKCA